MLNNYISEKILPEEALSRLQIAPRAQAQGSRGNCNRAGGSGLQACNIPVDGHV